MKPILAAAALLAGLAVLKLGRRSRVEPGAPALDDEPTEWDWNQRPLTYPQPFTASDGTGYWWDTDQAQWTRAGQAINVKVPFGTEVH